MTTLVDAPARVDGVELIGEMVGSGYRSPPALVRRADGQVLQLTPLLYLVLKLADGRRSCTEIAELVGRAMGRAVAEQDVRTLVDAHLRPLGLLTAADGSAPELRRADPLLRLKPRFAVTNPRTTRRLTDPFRLLFRPVVAVPVLAVFTAVVAWVFFDRGLGASAYDAFQRPHLLLLVFAVTVLSGGLHEFGHAAAARYGGGEPGAMGAGFYLVWPAFYTDVTDSYRLGRGGRIRTDLGGLYFNALVVVLTFGWWWATRWEALLLLVATQILQMVQQLQPLLRFDGYHVLADLAGVPDLYQRIKPTLLGLLPHRWKAPENRVLTPWARTVITLWVLVTVPLMAMMLFALIRSVPRLLGSAGSALGKDAGAVARAWSDGSLLDVAAHSLEVLGVVLPILAGALVLGRTGTRFARGLVRWGRGSTRKRVAAGATALAVLGGLAWAWWPDSGTYRPIQPGERGRFANILPIRHVDDTDGLRHGQLGAAAQQRLGSGRPLQAVFEKGQTLPTKEHPVLAMVLVPSSGAGAGASGSTGTGTPAPGTGGARGAGGGTGSDGTWVFPFDKPLPPEDGDNQALAVATKDGSMSYDLAFALVWADGKEALNVNEAHAYASCSDCVAVAVAFQVVLVMDDAKVVVPQNLAVAANYDCYRCITAAIANQLVLSVSSEPGQEQLRALGEVWNRLLQFGSRITSYSLTEVVAQLEAFKAEIVAILGEAPVVRPAATASATSDVSLTPPPTTDPTDSTTQSGTQSATQAPAPTGQATSEAPASSPQPSGQPSVQTTQPSAGDSPSPSDSPTTAAPTSGSDASPAPADSPAPVASSSP